MVPSRQSLLKIDVALEIQKLTQNRFKSGTEWAVALCRHLISQKSKVLEIRVENGHLRFLSQGTEINPRALQRLSVIFDAGKPLEERHVAIVEIEESPSFELLCAFYLKNANVHMRSNQNRLHVVKARHTTLSLQQATDANVSASPITVVDVKSGKIKAAILKKVLFNACRHARIPVYMNGVNIAEGLVLPNCFAQQAFEVDGVKGVVGIPMNSDFVRQVTLRHGVVVKDSLKQPAFGLLYHAIADSAHEIDELQHLRSVVRNQYLQLRSQVEQLHSAQRKRAIEVLFGRFLETKDRKYIYGVHAFENVEGLRYTIEQIQSLAAQGPLYGIPPQSEKSSPAWLACGRRVFALDARQWNFLEKELEISIVVPPVVASPKKISPTSIQTAQHPTAQPKPYNPDMRLAAERIFRNTD